MLNEIERHYYIERSARYCGQRRYHISLFHTGNAQCARRAHLLRGPIHTSGVLVASLVHGVQKGSVSTAELQNRRVPIGREVLPNDLSEKGEARLQPF